MKLMHLSDLHLGKRVHEYSMLPDQRYILDRILELVREEKPDGLLIAGDVYDKTVPSAEAVELFDDFLAKLAQVPVKVFLISGNHDSPERLAFGGRLMESRGVFVSPVYDGVCRPLTLEDAFGPVDLWLLPYIKPALARRFFPEAQIDSYTDALAAAVGAMDIQPDRRNVLLCHQFVTGAQTSESEELYVGGSENVDASVFAPFDYVALGHLHGPQNVGDPRIRYCGTPLKYSFSERRHHKSVTVIELREKGSLQLSTSPLEPLRDLVELRGSYEEVTRLPGRQDYVHVVLTDEEEIPNALGLLRALFPNLMKLSYDNSRTRSSLRLEADLGARSKNPLQLFGEFYEQQNGHELSGDQRNYLTALIQGIWNGA